MIELKTIRLLTPELILILLATWVLVASAFKPSRWAWTWFCAVGFGLVGIALWRQDSAIWQQGGLLVSETAQASSGPLLIDAFGHMARWLAVVLGLLFLPLAAYATRLSLAGEFLGAAALAFVGLMIVAGAGDVILLLLGMELISIPTYILLFLGRSDRRGSESAAKYFLLSILSSAMFLYGLSFLYGAAGSTNLGEIHRNIATSPDVVGAKFLPLGIILMLAGLGFKIAATPFHFYAPDVYQATTHANAGLLATLPKAAGMLAMVRLTTAAAPAAGELAWKILIVMSVLSMTLGNVCALWQSDLRRMMAYSSIAHAGYMLIGLATSLAAPAGQLGYDGVGAMLFYLIVYCGASLGTFATLAYLSSEQDECSSLSQLSELPRRHPLAAGLVAIFMFSLSGIPPLAGFWGKLTLFTSAMQQTQTGETARWFVVLLIVAALNAAIAAGYYLRVIATMFFGAQGATTDTAAPRTVSLLPGVTAVVCGAAVLGIGLFPGTLIEHARRAGMSAGAGMPTTILATSGDEGWNMATTE